MYSLYFKYIIFSAYCSFLKLKHLQNAYKYPNNHILMNKKSNVISIYFENYFYQFTGVSILLFDAINILILKILCYNIWNIREKGKNNMKTGIIVTKSKYWGERQLSAFQKTDYIKKLENIQKGIDLWQIDSIQRGFYAVKIPFQIINEGFNDSLNKRFYTNYHLSDCDLPTEHMWVQVADVNFESKKICGILLDSPLHIQLKEKDIVVVDFNDIESIQEVRQRKISLQ